MKSLLENSIDKKMTKSIKFNNIVDAYIIVLILIFNLLLKSLINLSDIFRYGFLKKEVLSNESNLGFDIKIIVK